MKKHLFLTGKKQIGKSTLIRTCLGETNVRLGGFYTMKAPADGDHVYVHMLRAGCDDSFRPENLLFDCRERGSDASGRFNEIGCRILKDTDQDAELIIMDEIGYRERNAVDFINAVVSVLDGDVPVLGVLRKSDLPLISAISGRSDVEVIEVTRGNRDELALSLPGRVKELLSAK